MTRTPALTFSVPQCAAGPVGQEDEKKSQRAGEGGARAHRRLGCAHGKPARVQTHHGDRRDVRLQGAGSVFPVEGVNSHRQLDGGDSCRWQYPSNIGVPRDTGGDR